MLLRVPADLAGDEDDAAGVDRDAVGIADRRRPAFGQQDLGGRTHGRLLSRCSAAGPGRCPVAVGRRQLGHPRLHQLDMLGFLGLQFAARRAHRPRRSRTVGQRLEEGLGALLGGQRELQRVPGLHQVVHRVDRHRLGRFEVAPGKPPAGPRGRCRPAHLGQDLLGVLALVAGHGAEQRRDLAVVVRLHRVGELGVALDGLALHRVGLRHELLQRARCRRGAGLARCLHSSNSASSSAGVAARLAPLAALAG